MEKKRNPLEAILGFERMTSRKVVPEEAQPSIDAGTVVPNSVSCTQLQLLLSVPDCWSCRQTTRPLVWMSLNSHHPAGDAAMRGSTDHLRTANCESQNGTAAELHDRGTATAETQNCEQPPNSRTPAPADRRRCNTPVK